MSDIINILIALVIYDTIKGIINWKSDPQNDIQSPHMRYRKKEKCKSFNQRLKEKMD